MTFPLPQKILNKIINELSGSDRKWKVFGMLLLAIAMAGTLLSLITKITLIRDDESTRPRIAVVGPMDGAEAAFGESLQRGAQLYAEVLNRQGGYRGRPIEILTVPEGADAAKQISADGRVVAVVGHLDINTLKEALPIYRDKKLPVVTPLFLAEPSDGVTSLGIDTREQARFVANYARNVVQQRLVYVIREDGAAFDPLVQPFIEVYKRFDTPVKHVWTISSGNAEDADVKSVLDALKNIDIGAVYLATRPALAARLVSGIRATGNALDVFGPEQLASSAFQQSLRQLSGKSASLQSHGIVAATPVLFDTANEEAQHFQTSFQQRYQASPDGLAVLSYDSVKVALTSNPGSDEVIGLTGKLKFQERQAQLPVQMGVYNGDRFISAPVQLLPIAKGANFNYIEALRQGRVLYVNDRFMFKTNVVYTGVTVNEVSDLDPQKEMATLDLSVWFRYRGNFKPQDLIIANAVDPVVFDTPEEVKESDEVQYRRYRIKQKFQLNFTDAQRAYGQHIAGISFRHRQLNRNNVMYVVDVLGMPTGNALIDDLHQRKVVKSATGWEADSAWVSQDVAQQRGEGAPQYVGMTGEQPQFSTITYGIMLKPATVSARDVISPEFFIYIAIFGLLGAWVANYLDVQRSGGYWALQTWLLRLIFWPMLLLSVGNITLDWAFNSLVPSTTRVLVLVYESLWWLIGAWLADKAVRRFAWEPLERKAQRRVPNVMKFFVSLLFFLLAFAGVIAFVFNQTLTSLLATSGVLAMVVGFAVQANIANVFSGIILNIERPFKVGDYVKINNIIGQVKDITWRTTRIEANDGQTLSLANSKVSESLMENFSEVPHGIATETKIYAPVDSDPVLVLNIVTEAVSRAKAVSFKEPGMYEPMVRYRGVVNLNSHWVAEFSAGYRVEILPKKSKAREQIWNYVRERFIAEGIPLLPSNAALIQFGPESK
jgi:potassium-dependent mechanosensitive channel